MSLTEPQLPLFITRVERDVVESTRAWVARGASPPAGALCALDVLNAACAGV
jgi:hypothetical protein